MVFMGADGGTEDGLTSCVAQSSLGYWEVLFAGTSFVLPFRKSLDELSIQWNIIQIIKVCEAMMHATTWMNI